jgi:hypothetical protein
MAVGCGRGEDLGVVIGGADVAVIGSFRAATEEHATVDVVVSLAWQRVLRSTG